MLHQFLSRIQDFFAVSPREARGLFFLMVVSVVLLAIPALLSQVILAPSEEQKARERAVIDSLIRVIATERDERKMVAVSAPKEQVVSRPKVSVTSSRQIIVPFDINRADTSQLKQLKGIGSGRARIIVNYRNALGGFHSIDQYGEIFGMDSLSLGQLRQYARILSPHARIKLNETSKEQLTRHPYARKYRRSVEAILRYRDQHGGIGSKEELKKVIPVDPEFLRLMEPYLEY